MRNIQEIATVSLQIQLNKAMYEGDEITYHLYSKANEILQARLYRLEATDENALNNIS